MATPAYAAREKDARKQKAAANAAKRKAETALVNLHRRQAALQPPQPQQLAPGQPFEVCQQMACPRHRT
jgi:hypothetical protein